MLNRHDHECHERQIHQYNPGIYRRQCPIRCAINIFYEPERHHAIYKDTVKRFPLQQSKCLESIFQHVDVSKTFLLNETDQNLYQMMPENAELRKTRFEVDWVHDLLYDRLKRLDAGLNPNADENTYTSFWVSPDLVALQTGVKGLISSGFIDENHFKPSAWRRSLARGTLSPK
ncbi:hypothetical protein BGX34_001412, partial [Mortierella sp. NVP85]